VEGSDQGITLQVSWILELAYAIALNQAFVSSRHCHGCFEDDEDGAAGGIDVSRVA
jgi:hypothetical protein